MASEPKKDSASETAMQAVEDALNIDFGEIEASATDKPEPEADIDPDFSELEQKLAEAANDLREESRGEEESEAASASGSRASAAGTRKQSRSRQREEAPEAPPMAEPADLLPANDERQDRLAEIVYSLQRQPSSARGSVLAIILSVFWLAFCGALLYVAFAQGFFPSGGKLTDILVAPALWGLIAAALIPLMLIWAFAALVRRAQDMRVAARTMAEAAIRLLQPEEMAATSVASVGRAIRREVAAINEGVERALARAGELEQIVESEVGNLERSYSDAEVRLKGLVSELAEERHEIVTHVDRLRSSLTDTHRGISDEVDAVAARIRSAVLATSSRVVDSLDREGQVVIGNLETVSGKLTEMLSRSGSQMSETISLRTSDFDRVVQERLAELDHTVEQRLTGFGTVLDGRIDGVFTKLSQQQKYVEDATTRIEDIVNDQITTAGKELELAAWPWSRRWARRPRRWNACSTTRRPISAR